MGMFDPDDKLSDNQVWQSVSRLGMALTALRRINSLDEENVPKYAKQIADEAIKAIES